MLLPVKLKDLVPDGKYVTRTKCNTLLLKR